MEMDFFGILSYHFVPLPYILPYTHGECSGRVHSREKRSTIITLDCPDRVEQRFCLARAAAGVTCVLRMDTVPELVPEHAFIRTHTKNASQLSVCVAVFGALTMPNVPGQVTCSWPLLQPQGPGE